MIVCETFGAHVNSSVLLCRASHHVRVRGTNFVVTYAYMYILLQQWLTYLQGLGMDIDSIMPSLEDRIFCLKTRDTAVSTVLYALAL